MASKIAWQQLTGSDKAVENTRRLRQVLEAPGRCHFLKCMLHGKVEEEVIYKRNEVTIIIDL